jgi:hypothetical protein
LPVATLVIFNSAFDPVEIVNTLKAIKMTNVENCRTYRENRCSQIPEILYLSFRMSLSLLVNFGLIRLIGKINLKCVKLPKSGKMPVLYAPHTIISILKVKGTKTFLTGK